MLCIQQLRSVLRATYMFSRTNRQRSLWFSIVARLAIHGTMSLMSQERLKVGIELFNRGEFFDAHEVLEDHWRVWEPETKQFVQGLVQAAVAFHHYSTGNRDGATSVLAKARRNLQGCPPRFGGIDVPQLLTALKDWQDCLDHGAPPPDLPQMCPCSSGPD